jgi:hypothetical protein
MATDDQQVQPGTHEKFSVQTASTGGGRPSAAR